MAQTLYEDLAPWWALLSPPEARAEDAAQILRWLQGSGAVDSLLELGAGVGSLAAGFPDAIEVVLLDLQPAMLEVSRRLHNPSREHVQGDMRSLSLGRTFDAVVLHDAAMYLLDPDDLVATFRGVAAHLAPGGRLVVWPDHVAEDFVEHVVSGHQRAADGREAALMEWHWDPVADDGRVTVDFALMLRDAAGLRTVHERHEMGCFPLARWWDAIRAAGLRPLPVPFDDLRDEGVGLLAVRP